MNDSGNNPEVPEWLKKMAPVQQHVDAKWRHECESAPRSAVPLINDTAAGAAQRFIACDRMRILAQYPIHAHFLYADTPSFANLDGTLDMMCEHASRGVALRLGDWIDDYLTAVCALHVASVSFFFPHHVRVTVKPAAESRLALVLSFVVCADGDDANSTELRVALHERANTANAVLTYGRDEWTSPSVPPSITRPGVSIRLRDTPCMPADVFYTDARWAPVLVGSNANAAPALLS